MNINKRLVPIFCILLVLFAVSIANGCSRKNESNVKDVVKNELDQLKNLNSETTQKYIPYKELFPGATENTGLSDEINEAFSLFSRNSITKFWISALTRQTTRPLLPLN